MSVKKKTEDNQVEILVVEDSPTQAEQLKYILEEEGYQVSVAHNGKEALSLINERKPTIVISDIIMPEMDGYQLCRQIRADKDLRSLPVILLTTLSDSSDVVKALECGADNFLTKPYEENYLLSRIKYFLINQELCRTDSIHLGLEVFFQGQKFLINSDRLQILNLLLSTYEAAVQKNNELTKAQEELRSLNEQLEKRVEHRTAEMQAEIVERKRIEEALRESEERFRRAAESSTDVIYEWNLKERVDWFGKIDEMLGYTPNEFPRTLEAWANSIHPNDRDRVMAAVKNHLEKNKPFDVEYRIKKKEGIYQYWLARGIAVRDEKGNSYRWVGAITDITERKRAEDRERLAREVLDVLNRTKGVTELIRDILRLVKKSMDFEALGIRLREGDDFPYYETNGFPEEFLQAERFLCAYDESGKVVRDGQGNPVLECMCGNILCGRTDVTLPFFTKGGSFWTNSTTDLLASTTEEDRQGRTRNRCNGEGYESVALIPLRFGHEIIGLLQFNDRRPNRFTPEMIHFFEGLGASIGIALSRKQMEEALRQAEENFRRSIDESPLGVRIVTTEGEAVYANQAILDMYGYDSIEELRAIPVRNRYTPESYVEHQIRKEKRQRGEDVPSEYEISIVRKNGEVRRLQVFRKQVHWNGKIQFQLIYRDVTELSRAEREMRSLQEQFRQAQKMEAIGHLAGGIAHDFNNLLTVILGYSQISLMDLGEDSPFRENLEEIRQAAERAANLTRQLLAFSRRQILEMKVLDLNSIVKDLNKMLCRVIGEDIELFVLLSEDLGWIRIDRGQMEQVLLNLAVNAKDAMSGGGKLIIETANVDLDEAYARNHVSVKPGHYVMLSVTDTGVGMSPEVMKQIFEPFFTTKERGKGTGLGLSTAYGIVKQSGGNIWAYSEPGKGTTFKIYLPRVEESLEETSEKKAKKELPGGGETLLVVEDEDIVRKLTVKLLRQQGYQVLEARHWEEAITLCKERQDPIHLILTDVVMPGGSGPHLMERLKEVRRDFKVIYMSGYADNTIVKLGILDQGIPFLQKPFTQNSLLRKVREVLDQ
jgi:PAS domain S-box-containing protein